MSTSMRHRLDPRGLSRRELLGRCAGGIGALALGSIVHGRAAGGEPPSARTHHAAKARSVIFLYMDGGPSQIDTFDHKPLLDLHHGRKPGELFRVEPTQFNRVGSILRSPWAFTRHGACGRAVSALFPHLARHVDRMAFLHAMTTRFPEHTSANYFLHTGSGIQGRPSMGAWASYGLGDARDELPAYIVLDGGLTPPGGIDCFGAGFLPAAHQASVFRPRDPPIANVRPRERPELQREKHALRAARDRAFLERSGGDDAVASAIQNAEAAFRMQATVPELMDLRGESAATRALYGLDDANKHLRTYATQCLLARRMVERGVRFVQLTCPPAGGDRWDQHGGLKAGHEANAGATDKPIAGLLADLAGRGLLDSTLVVWAGEFGRTPFAQGSDGRDHNQFGFTVWLAGGGVRGGVAHGATDEWGYKAVSGATDIHDLHATMLHLLGFDHARLTWRFGGRDMRLTDVHGNVVREILA